MYLEKPFSLDFDDAGIATIDFTDLVLSSDLKVNPIAKTITSDGGGSFSVDLPSEGIYLTMVTRLTLEYEGTDIVDNLEITDAINGNINPDYTNFYSSRYNLDFSKYAANAGQINTIKWNCNSTGGTMTLKSIKLTANVITATNGHETNLTAALFHGWSAPGADATIEKENVNGACVLNQASSLPYGDASVGMLNYADISDFDKLIVTVASGTPRFCFNRMTANGQDNADESLSNMMDINDNQNAFTWAKESYQTIEGNVYTIDLAKMVKDKGFAHLNCIKGAYWGSPVVTSMILYKNEAEFDYNIQGSGLVKQSVVDALADGNANLYDATGVTGAVELVAANPNAVILANDPAVTGTNVVVDGTCADFAIVDNKPYKYNGAFSAASAKQTVTVSAAGFSTTVVPFNAAVPSGLKAYNVEAINADNTIAVEEVTSVVAGKPVLLEGEGTFTFEASGASVAASAGALSNGILTASYAGLDVTGGGYVLQNQEEGVAFYKFEGARSMKPFRAYIPATGASGAKTLNIGIGESTGIMALNHADATTVVRYNAAGQKLNGMQKGLNIVKMSNGEVKKVFVK